MCTLLNVHINTIDMTLQAYLGDDVHTTVMSNTGQWGWITRGAVLEVVDLKRMTRVATRSLGTGGSESNSVIQCCAEVHTQIYHATLFCPNDDVSLFCTDI